MTLSGSEPLVEATGAGAAELAMQMQAASVDWTWMPLLSGLAGGLAAAALVGLLRRRRSAAGGATAAPDGAAFRLSDGRLVPAGRRGAQGAAEAVAAGLSAVEGPERLETALRALENEGLGFRLLADDPQGGAWEVSGVTEGGEARVLIAPAGPARRELARLRAEIGRMAQERDAALEALEAAPILAWRRDGEGQVVWGNARYRRMAGAREDAPAGAEADPLPELRRGEAGETGSGERPEGRQAVFDARTGERRWFDLRRTPSASGGTLGFGADASAAVHAEGALRRFVETLTETFAHLRIGLAIFDREMRLGLFNPAFAEMMRLEPPWLAGRPTLPDVLERLRENRRIPDQLDYAGWRQGLLSLHDPSDAAGRRERTELWHLPGEEQIRMVARPHTQGAVAFLFEDVSEAARLERRWLTETEIRRAVMDRLEEGVAAFGPDGVARFANPAFAAMWGFHPGAEPEGLRLDEALERFRARSRASPVWERLSEFFHQTGLRAAWSEEATLTDGRRLRARVAALPDGSVLVAFSDVTDAMRLETATRERIAALEAMDAIRAGLVEQVAERLSEPLAIAAEAARALQAGEREAAETATEISAALAEVREAMEGAAELRLPRPSQETIGPASLRGALTSALEVAQSRARARGVTLTLEAGDEAAGDEASSEDAARVRQLLFNLVADAIHRAPPGAEVRAGARRRGSGMEIWTDEPAGGGAASVGRGLAHALVRRFAELHGGELRVETPENGRLRVVFALPDAALSEVEGDEGAGEP